MPRKVTNIDVKHAYQRLFLAAIGIPSEVARLVLGDLAKFTGALQAPTQFDASGRVDTKATLIAIGRADVWRHIDQMLNLPSSNSMALLQDAINVGVEHDRHDD